jgi:quercetin dioxygenase-like cupin family protein
MKRLSILAPILALATLVLPAAVAFSQQSPAPVTVLEKRFPATAPPGPYDMVLLVLDLAPGTEFPIHTHGGPVFATVVEGTFWERSGGQRTVLQTGDTLAEETGRMHEAGNDGPGTTRLLITVLLPKGAALTTDTQTGANQDLPAGATVTALATLPAPQAPEPLDVVQRLTDLPVGGVVPYHTHPGPNFNILLQGRIVLDMEGMAHTYTADDNWVEPANLVHGGSNTGSTTARIVGSALVPRGAPVAIPAQQPAAPAVQPPPVAKPAIAPVQVPAR